MLPHDHDAEQAVLGAIMLDNAAHDIVAGIIEPGDFYAAGHAKVYRAIAELLADGKPADPITVGSVSDDPGAMHYLATLMERTPSAVGAGSYAKIVREKSISRKLMAVGSDLQTRAQDEPAKELIEATSQKLHELGATRSEDRVVTSAELARSTMKLIEQAYKHKGEVTGIRTGYAGIDEMLGGLQFGDFYVVGARPSMGKTALLLALMKRAAIRHGHRCAVFSLEMSKEQLGLRLMASESGVDYQRIKRGLLADTDWARLARGTSDLAAAPLSIDDTAANTLGAMRRTLRRIIATEGKVDIVGVDYLQLMRPERRSDNREREIAEFSQGLKCIAKDFGLATIALAQLNRECEKRADKRPMMSDLRESGAIEQDADAIGFLYRDEVYNQDTDAKGVAELIWAKNRNGPTGTVKLKWDGETQRFETLEAGR